MVKNLIYKAAQGFSPLPLYLAVNITNRCNRTCSFCPYHSPTLADTEHNRWVKSQPKDMDVEKFHLFLHNIKHKVKHIAITGKGEPMMHPHFMLFCDTVDMYGIPFSVTTNGDYLTTDKQWLLEQFENLKLVRVSVYDNPQHWLDVQAENIIPIELFNQTGGHIDGMEDGFTVYCEGNAPSTRTKDFNTKTTCRAPFSFITINTDGSLVPCYSYNEVGNGFTEKFGRIWNGSNMRRFRKDALTMTARCSDCKNCSL